ncbi:MAG TPA: type II toxin-antitoxin system VapC family toxin [Blastocatellia bacterium]|nr:type II toxin-antitoxin system VapC family toxin [Blastocatellia bacterium]
MNYVLDSNVLLRMAQDTHPMHAAATQATTTLIRQGDTVHIIPQNLYEFWSVATREIKYNGLGLSVGDAQNELARLRSLFSYLPDTPAVCSQWERLIVQYTVIGRDSHDTRIVAAMNVHGVTHLLAFNKDDFRRYTNIVAVSPEEVIAAQPSAPAAKQPTATEADEEIK